MLRAAFEVQVTRHPSPHDKGVSKPTGDTFHSVRRRRAGQPLHTGSPCPLGACSSKVLRHLALPWLQVRLFIDGQCVGISKQLSVPKTTTFEGFLKAGGASAGLTWLGLTFM